MELTHYTEYQNKPFRFSQSNNAVLSSAEACFDRSRAFSLEQGDHHLALVRGTFQCDDTLLDHAWHLGMADSAALPL